MLKISTLSTSPRQKLRFDLHKEVKMITSHFTWIDQCVPFIEESSLELAPDQTVKGYFRILLDHHLMEGSELDLDRTNDDDDVEDVGSDSTHGFIALKFNRATMYAYVGDFKAAYEQLDETKTHMKFISDPVHVKIVVYCLDALKWAIEMWEMVDSEQQPTTLRKEHFEKVADFCQRWDNLNLNEDIKTKAMIIFLKGCLASALKVQRKKVLNYFVEATKLDPSYHVWFHYAYRKMRSIRKDGKGTRPEGEEIHLCKTAYKLRPKEDVVTVLDYAILLKERLWREPKAYWDDHEGDYLLCQKLLEDVAAGCQAKMSCFAFKAKFLLADLLLFGKGDKLDQDKGRRMLRDLEKEYPRGSSILHKMGKLYYRGAYGSFKWRNPILAEKFYDRAIDVAAGNFPCLMEYLRFLEDHKTYDCYQKMLSIIERGLNFVKHDSQVAKLQAMKGSVLWLISWRDGGEEGKSKRIMACEPWILVLEKLSNHADEVYKSIEDSHNVIITLENMLSKAEYVSKRKWINVLIDEIRRRVSEKSTKQKVAVADVRRGSKPGPKPVVVTDQGGTTGPMKPGKGKGGNRR